MIRNTVHRASRYHFPLISYISLDLIAVFKDIVLWEMDIFSDYDGIVVLTASAVPTAATSEVCPRAVADR